MKNNIFPCLWCNSKAQEVAAFYSDVFGASVISQNPFAINLNIFNQPFLLIEGKKDINVSAANSMLIVCNNLNEFKAMWEGLMVEGSILMPFDTYPFADCYGWVRDKFGMTWQLYFKEGYTSNQRLVPVLTFGGKNNGKAKSAIDFYTSIFPNSKIEGVLTYEQGGEDDIPNNIQHAEFLIDGFRLGAMDSSHNVDYSFTEAVSNVVFTTSQKETDTYWEQLLVDGGQAQMCGWLKDKYGLSWQIVPESMLRLINDTNATAKAAAATNAMLNMQKIDIEVIEAAYNQA